MSFDRSLGVAESQGPAGGNDSWFRGILLLIWIGGVLPYCGEVPHIRDEPVADLIHRMRLLAAGFAAHGPGHALADGEQDAGLLEREKLGAHIGLGFEI